MMEQLCSEFLVRLICEFAEHVIRWIATETGADDLVFLLLRRVRRGFFTAIAAAGRLIWAALEDRCIWLYVVCAGVNASVLAIRSTMAALEYESALFFFGCAALVTAVSFFIRPYVMSLHASRWLVAFIVAAATVALIFVISQITRWIHEHPSERIINARMIVSCGLIIAGAVGVGFVVHGTSWYGAVYCGTSILSWFFGLVIVSRLVDSVEIVQHEYLVTSWGPGGRPYTRHVVRTHVRPIVRNQRERRGGSF